MMRVKVVVSLRVSSRTGRDGSVGLCGSEGSADLYETWGSGDRMRFEVNLCVFIGDDKFS